MSQHGDRFPQSGLCLLLALDVFARVETRISALPHDAGCFAAQLANIPDQFTYGSYRGKPSIPDHFSDLRKIMAEAFWQAAACIEARFGLGASWQAHSQDACALGELFKSIPLPKSPIDMASGACIAMAGPLAEFFVLRIERRVCTCSATKHVYAGHVHQLPPLPIALAALQCRILPASPDIGLQSYGSPLGRRSTIITRIFEYDCAIQKKLDWDFLRYSGLRKASTTDVRRGKPAILDVCQPAIGFGELCVLIAAYVKILPRLPPNFLTRPEVDAWTAALNMTVDLADKISGTQVARSRTQSDPFKEESAFTTELPTAIDDILQKAISAATEKSLADGHTTIGWEQILAAMDNSSVADRQAIFDYNKTIPDDERTFNRPNMPSGTDRSLQNIMGDIRTDSAAGRQGKAMLDLMSKGIKIERD